MKKAKKEDLPELKNICATMLDNADLQLHVLNDPFSVSMVFHIIGMKEKVLIRCQDICFFSLLKKYLDDNFYVVLEADIELADDRFLEPPFTNMYEEKKNIAWRFRVTEPDIQLEIICGILEWEVAEKTAEDAELFS